MSTDVNRIYRSGDNITEADILALEEDTRSRQETIHQELSKIAAKKRIINNLLPAVSLSEEVLTNVFLHFSTNPFSYHKPTKDVDYHFPDPCDWIAVTQVCHRWRDIALKTPKLWRLVYLGPPQLVGEFIMRSGQELLHIYPWSPETDYSISSRWRDRYRLQRLSEESSTASLKLVLTQLHRIEVLIIQLQSQLLENVFTDHADLFNVPVLKKIIFAHDVIYPISDSNVVVQSNAPAAQRSEFSEYRILRRFAQIDVLNTLVVHDQGRPRAGCHVHELLGILSAAKGLKVLEYADTLCTGEDLRPEIRSQIPSTSVNLPRLETLTFHSAPACIDFFLAQCTFPPSTSILLQASNRPRNLSSTTGAQTMDILCSIQYLLYKRVWERRPITGLELSSSLLEIPGPSPRGYMVFIKTYHFDPSSISSFVGESQLRRGVRFKFQYHPDSDTQGHFDPICTLLLGLPLSSVVYLNIYSPPIRRYPDSVHEQRVGSLIVDIIMKCSKYGLQALDIGGPCISLLPFILTSWSDRHITKDSASTVPISIGFRERHMMSLFSSLHTLILTDSQYYENQQSTPLYSSLFDVIQSQANFFTGFCCGFSKLIIQRCQLPPIVLLELVDSVADLIRQRGRFTTDLPTVSFNVARAFPSHLYNYQVALEEPLEPLPDADLDAEPNFAFNVPLVFHGPIAPLRRTWVDYIGRGRITFDFRGSSGIRVEQNSHIIE